MSATRQNGHRSPFEMVVVLGSMGALEPLKTLVGGLPRRFRVPVLVLMHRASREEPDALARLLQRRTEVPVRIARSGGSAQFAGITVIPAGETATVGEDHRLRFIEYDSGHGGDVLLSTAAAVLPGAVLGVVLSGMLRDGSEGVRSIKRRGGRTLAQDPLTARASGMPASAIATGCVDFVLPPSHIPSAVVALTLGPGASDLFKVPSPHWARLEPSGV